jgi:hypothetical protein
MPKYLLQASYTPDGTKGLLQEGGSKRRAEDHKLVKGLGGGNSKVSIMLSESLMSSS